jgi:ubiquinone/menaquinone biosynthesis C-methylase UbiE
MTNFDEPSLWRLEAARVLGFHGEDLIAAMTPGAAFPAVLRSIAAALPVPCHVIVDLGAGSGGASEWLRRATGAAVVAIEPAAGSRAAAVRAFPALHVVGGSADCVPVRDAVADAFVVSGVMSLLSDIAPIMVEVDRVLTGIGCVAIGDLFSNVGTRVTAGPNTFRTVEEVMNALVDRRFTPTSVGLGDPEPDPAWARIAETIDGWIAAHCAERAGYRDWKHDQEHLAQQKASGNLIGGCVVAERSRISD